MIEQWRAAYSAFVGAFDHPVARRKHDDEFAKDARERLRDFNEDINQMVAQHEQESKHPLKNCPHCGDDELEGGAPFPLNREQTSWTVQCGNPSCGASVEAPTKQEAIERWNRRVDELPGTL